MADGGVNGVAIVALLAGGVLAYSGIKGKGISTVVRLILEGNNPSTAAQINPITDPSASDPSIGGNGGTGGDSGGGGGGGNNAPLSYAQIRSYWTQAGGPGGAVAVIAAAITEPESGRNPDAVQSGVDYAHQGWGLWQITPGDSEPQIGTDAQLLDPLTNARAAVAKYEAAGNSFTPWTTFTSGKYAQYLSAASK